MSEPSPHALELTVGHGPESAGSPDDQTPNTLATAVDVSDGEESAPDIGRRSAPHASELRYGRAMRHRILIRALR